MTDIRKMKIIDAEATRDALSFERVIPTLRDAFLSNAEVPARHVHYIESHEARGTSLIMPAWNSQGYFGVKVINIFPENTKLGIPGLHSTYNLYSSVTGVPLAHVDGDVITGFRTAGAAAVGASYLSREDSKTLLILGSGRIASLVASAMATVRPIETVLIWNYRYESAVRLAESLGSQQKFQVQPVPVEDLESAVAQADIISCATLSTSPIVSKDWMRPGTHLDLIGSFQPDMIEAHPDCFKDTTVYVDTDEAPTKAGDLLGAFKAGTLTKEDIKGTLFDLVHKRQPGRTSSSEITVFKAVGSALEDLAMAAMVYEHYNGK